MKLILLTLSFLSISLSLLSQHEIIVKLSTKVILNPDDGNVPPGYSTDQLQANIDTMNAIMSKFDRGIKFQNSESIEIGGIGHPISSQYYNAELSFTNKNQLELDAEASPSTYQWREDHINIYINGTTLGDAAGFCSFTPDIGDEIILLRTMDGFNGYATLHEIGHYFDLRHTFQGQSGDRCTHPNPVWNPGQDLIDDTLDDHQCWTSINQMTQHAYNLNFDALNSDQQKDATRSFFNSLSYRGATEDELTEQQLNKIADMIRLIPSRSDVVIGLPYFVNDNTDCTQNSNCLGTAYEEFINVDYSLDAVNPNGDDAIIIRPGTYDVTRLVISQPVFITGTRDGDVILK